MKKATKLATGRYPKNMQAMLDDLGLPLQGRRLSGCDDTLNYLTILKEIALRGYVLDNNSSLFDAAELRKLELFLYQSTCGNSTISSQCGNLNFSVTANFFVFRYHFQTGPANGSI